jgi:hypothetical protein
LDEHLFDRHHDDGTVEDMDSLYNSGALSSPLFESKLMADLFSKFYSWLSELSLVSPYQRLFAIYCEEAFSFQRTHLSHHNCVIVVLKQLHMTYMRLFSVRQCLVLKRNLSALNSYLIFTKRIGVHLSSASRLVFHNPALVGVDS